MKKRSYRAQKVNEVRWEEVADRVKDRAVVWGHRCGQGRAVWGTDGRRLVVEQAGHLQESRGQARIAHVHPVPPKSNTSVYFRFRTPQLRLDPVPRWTRWLHGADLHLPIGPRGNRSRQIARVPRRSPRARDGSGTPLPSHRPGAFDSAPTRRRPGAAPSPKAGSGNGCYSPPECDCAAAPSPSNRSRRPGIPPASRRRCSSSPRSNRNARFAPDSATALRTKARS